MYFKEIHFLINISKYLQGVMVAQNIPCATKIHVGKYNVDWIKDEFIYNTVIVIRIEHRASCQLKL